MRCLKCGSGACIEIRRHRAAYCEEHFVEHVHKQVTRAVRKFKMFEPGEKLLLAVSGGKDSLALWDVLLDLGYQADGLYIDLGIGDYSARSREKAENFAGARRAALHVVSLPETYGVNVGYIAKKSGKPFCSTCGLVKRYIMNAAASIKGYDAVVTGHNLDDEAGALLGNALSWQVGYLRRQSPNMPASQGLVRKVKPLCRLGERETAAYCIIKGINYILEECPMAKGASSLAYKDVLNALESRAPGTKDRFYLGFLREGRHYFQGGSEEPQLRPCSVCGQPTTAETCSFCRQVQRAGLDPLAVLEAIKNSGA